MPREIAPGYCVVEKYGSLAFHAGLLFKQPDSPAGRYFMEINRDTQTVFPGQILIVADPDSKSATTLHMLRTLRQAKQQVNNALTGVDHDTASFLQRNYGMIAGLTSAGDKIFGIAGDAGEKYFSAIEKTLRKIEETYQNQFRTHGTLISQQFFIERARLFAELKELVNKPLLRSLARHSIKFRPYDDIRRALNLSSRAIVHEWSTVGIGAIPGYVNYTSRAAKAVRFLKYGGYIGIGFSFAGTTNDIVHICTTGRTNECGKVAFRGYSKFAFSTIGSIAGGVAGASTITGVCIGIGIATAGTGILPCSIIGSIAGGFAGGSFGEALSEHLIEKFLD